MPPSRLPPIVPPPLGHCPPPRWAWAGVTRARRTPAGRKSERTNEAAPGFRPRAAHIPLFLGCQCLSTSASSSLLYGEFLNPHSVNTHDFHTCTNTHTDVSPRSFTAPPQTAASWEETLPDTHLHRPHSRPSHPHPHGRQMLWVSQGLHPALLRPLTPEATLYTYESVY